MKIIGTGVDIVEVARIKTAAKTSGFLKRVFSPEELSYSLKGKKKWEHLAVRFAAKEAVWKSLGQQNVALQKISVTRTHTGKPLVDLKNLPVPKRWKASISLAHSDNYAVAYCLVYEQ